MSKPAGEPLKAADYQIRLPLFQVEGGGPVGRPAAGEGDRADEEVQGHVEKQVRA